MIGLDRLAGFDIAGAAENLVSGNANVLWLEAQCCSGCSVSLLNSEHPRPAALLTSHINLLFHQTLSTATGHGAVKAVNDAINAGGFILVVEGTIPDGMPEACVFGGETLSDQLKRAAAKAKAVVALGSCAAFGGIPAAEGNPTGAISVPDFFKKYNINHKPILIPGCPIHPDWFVGTLVHLLAYGAPKLDSLGRPAQFFSRTVHEQCPRFRDYELENFAKNFGDPGCLFKLGCLGPNTNADCTLRGWNGNTNQCIRAGAPCVGCASREFTSRKNFPLYRINQPKPETK
jgi:hydrogenase small subunit